jgi:hypothetical protein
MVVETGVRYPVCATPFFAHKSLAIAADLAKLGGSVYDGVAANRKGSITESSPPTARSSL